MAYNAEKKSHTVVWQEKNSYPNQITHLLCQKSNGRPLTRESLANQIAEFVIIC